MVSIDVVSLRFSGGFGITSRAETAGNYLIGLDGKNFELAVSHAARFFLKQLFTGNLLLLKRHIHQVPASESRAAAFAFFLQLFYALNDVQRLTPSAEHLPVGVCLYLFFCDLRQGGEKCLSKRRAALRRAFPAGVT